MPGRSYVGVWMDDSFINAIDEDRGIIDQSTYLRKLVFEKLGTKHTLDEKLIFPKDRARANREARRKRKIGQSTS